MLRPSCLVGALVVALTQVAVGRAEGVTLNPGDILVADFINTYNLPSTPGAIYRVDPTTGAQTTIT